MELLAPAGDWSCLRAAVRAGCDSVYFGLEELNMRALAKNFKLSELKKIVNFCHQKKVRCYLALNAIIYQKELLKAKKILEAAKKADIDAVICWDFSVISLCEKLKIPIHLSTQASISNFEAIKILKNKFKQIESINLARELALSQIKEIKNKIKKENLKVKLEVFIHGARCISISGRCFISQELFGKSANRGECLQPCRREYLVKDEEGKELRLENNFVMSPKDLCALPILDKLAFADCFKIEGRKRDAFYVAKVVSVYRRALEAIKEKRFNPGLIQKLTKELEEAYNRGYNTGFLLGYPSSDSAGIYGSKATKEKLFLGKVKNFYQKIMVAEFKIESHGFKVKDRLAFIGPTTGCLEIEVKEIHDSSSPIQKAGKGELVSVKTNQQVRKNDLVYLIKKRKS